MECEEYRDRGDDMARLGTAKSRLSTYLLVLALTTPAMVLGQSRQAQPPAQTEEERARELAVIDAEIARAEAEARAAEAEARAAEAEARAAEATETAETAIEQAGNIAETAIERAADMAESVVRDPSLSTTFNVRSWGRTGTGLGLIAAGVMFGLRPSCASTGGDSVDYGSGVPFLYLAPDNIQLSSDKDWLWGQCSNTTAVAFDVIQVYQGDEIDRWQSLSDVNAVLARQGYSTLDEHDFFPYGAAWVDWQEGNDAARAVIGFGMIGVGALLATVWSDVPGVDLAASITPGGGLLLSRSLGW